MYSRRTSSKVEREEEGGHKLFVTVALGIWEIVHVRKGWEIEDGMERVGPAINCLRYAAVLGTVVLSLFPQFVGIIIKGEGHLFPLSDWP